MDNIKEYLKKFWEITKETWKISKVTMLIKPFLYLLIAFIGIFQTNIVVLIPIGVLIFILDFIVNTVENKNFKEEIDAQNEKIDKLNSEVKAKRTEISELQEEVEIAGEIREKHLNDFLKFLFIQFGLGRTDRISVYYRQQRDNNFLVIARYSSHPTYSVQGRTSYPKNKGFISKCWEGDSDDFLKILPTIGSDEYFEEQQAVGYSRDEVTNLKMKPRTFYVLNVAKDNLPSIGVIVIESTKDRLGKFNSNGDEKNLHRKVSKKMKVYVQYLYDIMDTKSIRE